MREHLWADHRDEAEPPVVDGADKEQADPADPAGEQIAGAEQKAGDDPSPAPQNNMDKRDLFGVFIRNIKPGYVTARGARRGARRGP